jgi:hypothetical protein
LDHHSTRLYLDGLRDVRSGSGLRRRSLVVGSVAAVEAVAAARRRSLFCSAAAVLQEAPDHSVQAERAGLQRRLLLPPGTRDDRREPLRRRDPQHLALEQPLQPRLGRRRGRIDLRSGPHGVSEWRIRRNETGGACHWRRWSACTDRMRQSRRRRLMSL